MPVKGWIVYIFWSAFVFNPSPIGTHSGVWRVINRQTNFQHCFICYSFLVLICWQAMRTALFTMIWSWITSRQHVRHCYLIWRAPIACCWAASARIPTDRAWSRHRNVLPRLCCISPKVTIRIWRVSGQHYVFPHSSISTWQSLWPISIRSVLHPVWHSESAKKIKKIKHKN